MTRQTSSGALTCTQWLAGFSRPPKIISYPLFTNPTVGFMDTGSEREPTHQKNMKTHYRVQELKDNANSTEFHWSETVNSEFGDHFSPAPEGSKYPFARTRSPVNEDGGYETEALAKASEPRMAWRSAENDDLAGKPEIQGKRKKIQVTPLHVGVEKGRVYRIIKIDAA